MAGRPRTAVVLTAGERAALQGWTRSRSCAQGLALRARIVLACADTATNTEVAQLLGVSRDMVTKWRTRFLTDRLAGLDERPRPGRPPTADDDTVAHVLLRTLTPPGGGRAWSTRSMAAETGLSQSTVNRVWRTYGIRPGPVPGRRPWSLPEQADEVVGVFIAPPVCVVAVTVSKGVAGKGVGRAAADRLLGHDPRAAHVLGVACAFAALRGGEGTAEGAAASVSAEELEGFVREVRGVATGAVHLLGYGFAGSAEEAAELQRGFDTGEFAGDVRRLHRAPDPAEWAGEMRRLLGDDGEEAAVSGERLRDALLAWASTWTPAAAPFTRVAAPRPEYDTVCGRNTDSPPLEERSPATTGAAREGVPGAPVTLDPVVGRLRDAVLTSGHRPGERVREAPLAARLGLSRRVVRAGLRALAEEGMLEVLPGGATAVPAVTAKDVLDLYALRASLGALLIRRVAMLGPECLAPAGEALAEVRAAARDRDHVRIREVDLWFQDALARTADLPQAARTFEQLTARLRMFVTALDMDYSQACDTITNEDTAVYEALRTADGNEAARLWRVKIERCVRYMIARLPEDEAAPHVWTTLAGRPRLHPGP